MLSKGKGIFFDLVISKPGLPWLRLTLDSVWSEHGDLAHFFSFFLSLETKF